MTKKGTKMDIKIHIPYYILYPFISIVIWVSICYLTYKIAGEGSIFIGFAFMLLIVDTIRLFFQGLEKENEAKKSTKENTKR
jgi:hypothetical protein